MITFWDGFDFLSGSNNGRRWDVSNSTPVTGVYGNGKALVPSTLKLKTLGVNYATIWFCFHYFTGTIAACNVIGFEDAGTVQVDFRMDSTGHIVCTRNSTVLGTSTAVLANNSWYWVLGHVTVNNTTGVAEIKIGTSYPALVTFLSLTAQNTRATANNFANQLYIDSASNRTQQFDNLVLWDTTAGTGNDLTGDPGGEIIIDNAFVTGAGSSAQFTPSAGSNYQNVDESPTSNDDTDYNSSVTSGQIDDFAVSNLVASAGTIIAIAQNNEDRIDDASAHTVGHYLKSSAATDIGAAYTPGATYGLKSRLVFLDPNTGAAPTVAGRNAMTFGYKMLS